MHVIIMCTEYEYYVHIPVTSHNGKNKKVKYKIAYSGPTVSYTPIFAIFVS